MIMLLRICKNSITVWYVKQSVKALRNAAHPESFVYDQMRETPASDLCCVLFSYDTAYDAEHETASAFHPLSVPQTMPHPLHRPLPQPVLPDESAQHGQRISPACGDRGGRPHRYAAGKAVPDRVRWRFLLSARDRLRPEYPPLYPESLRVRPIAVCRDDFSANQ